MATVNQVEAIGDLKAIGPSARANGDIVLVQGYWTPGDGGGGEYSFDTQTIAFENDGTIVKPNDVSTTNGRWIRVISDRVELQVFGGRCDGTTDDTAALARCVDVGAIEYGLGSSGTGYVVGDVLALNGGAFTQAASIKVTGVSSGAVTGAYQQSPGFYASVPSSPAGVTGGTGSGATFAFTGAIARRARTVSLRTAGSGYAVNDILVVSGGSVPIVTTLRVTAVSSGAITAVAIEEPGFYATVPSNPVSVTVGSATFDLGWAYLSPEVVAISGEALIKTPSSIVVPEHVVLRFSGAGRLKTEFSSLQSVKITYPASNYTSIPSVSLSGGNATLGTVHMLLSSATVSSGGSSGYAVGDVLELNNDGGTSVTKARLTVSAVSGGVVTAVTVSASTGPAVSEYSVLPTASPVSTTKITGSGTGAVTLTSLKWGVHSVPIASAGSGYVTAPTISFGAGTATAIAVGEAITLDGDIDAPVPRQIFSGTGAINLSTPSTWNRIVAEVCPEYWGALGLDGSDDTIAVQKAFDSQRPVRFHRDYPVTQVTLTGSYKNIDGNEFSLVGRAVSATTSVLEIKCGYSHLKSLAVDVERRTNYECGVHWYSNNVGSLNFADGTVYYPGHNRIDGLYVQSALIGVVIGALPSQSTIQAQGVLVANGEATDAPLSESYIHGYESSYNIKSIWMRQPNGKIVLSGADLAAETTGWTGQSGTDAKTICVRNDGSELSIVGSALHCIPEPTGTLIEMTGGLLDITQTIIETSAKSWLAGSSVLRLSNILTFGLNFSGKEAFTIDKTATGSLSLTDCRCVKPADAYTNDKFPLFYCRDGGLTSSFAINNDFIVRLTNVELRDAPFSGVTTYAPPARGVRVGYKNCELTSYSGTRSVWLHLDEGVENRLSGQIDVSGASCPTGTTNLANGGGWTYGGSGGSSYWYVVAVGGGNPGPDPEDVPLSYTLKLLSASGGNCQLTSPKLWCQPSKSYLLSGFIKSEASSNVHIIRVKFYKFDGTASSVDTDDDAINATGSAIGGNGWEPLSATFRTPSDCEQLEVMLRVEGAGGSLELAYLTVA